MLARVWVVNTVCWLSPVLRKPHHHAVADQGILPHPFDARQIADFDRDRLAGKDFARKDNDRSGKREQQ